MPSLQGGKYVDYTLSEAWLIQEWKCRLITGCTEGGVGQYSLENVNIKRTFMKETNFEVFIFLGKFPSLSFNPASTKPEKGCPERAL